MTRAEIIQRQALRELLQLIRDLHEKEENDEHNHTDYRRNAGQPEPAR